MSAKGVIRIGSFTPRIQSWMKSQGNPKKVFQGRSPVNCYRVPKRYDGGEKATCLSIVLHGHALSQKHAAFTAEALRMYAEEQFGFTKVPVGAFQQIHFEVSNPLKLRVDETADSEEHIRREITPADIFRKLQHLIYTEKMKPKDAAKEVWKDFKITEEEAKISRLFSKTRRINTKANSSNDVFTSLVNAAKEVAVLTYGFEVSKIVATKSKKDAKAYIKGLKHIGRSVKKALFKLQGEEIEAFNKAQAAKNKAVKLRQEAENLRVKDKLNKALKLEAKARYLEKEYFMGNPLQFAARYRHKRARPELAKPEPMDFLETMVHWATTAGFGETYNELGFEKSDAEIFRKIGEIGRESLPQIPKELRYKTYAEVGSKEGKNIIHFLDECKERLRETLEGKKNKIIPYNVADQTRYPLPKVPELGGRIAGIYDAESLGYPELLELTSAFRAWYGNLQIYPYQAIQCGIGYEWNRGSELINTQFKRDSTAKENKGSGDNNLLLPTWQIIDRWKMRSGTPTFTGYANWLDYRAWLTASFSRNEVNPQNTSWYGRNALEHILGLEWWNKKDGVAGLINRNARRIGGFGNGWMAMMAIDRAIKWTSLASGAFLGAYAGMQGVLGSGPITLPMALPEIFAYSTATWMSLFGLSRLIGGRRDIYQYVTMTRCMPWDPSEDYRLTIEWLKKQNIIIQVPGTWVHNDCTKSPAEDLAQKDRWIAQNAKELRINLPIVWKYREVLSFPQIFEMLTIPIYQNFSIANTFNRLALWGFILFGAPAMLLLDQNIYTFPVSNNLGWVLELGAINYFFIRLMLRYSRMHEGQTADAAYRSMTFDYFHTGRAFWTVQERLYSNVAAAFGVTNVTDLPTGEEIWGSPDPKTGRTPMSFYMRMNVDSLILTAYCMARVARHALGEGIMIGDLFSLAMGSLLLWTGVDARLTAKGTFKFAWDGNMPFQVYQRWIAKQGDKK